MRPAAIALSNALPPRPPSSAWPNSLKPRASWRYLQERPDALFVDFYNHVPLATRIATEADVVTHILALADGRISEEALAEWIRQRCSRHR